MAPWRSHQRLNEATQAGTLGGANSSELRTTGSWSRLSNREPIGEHTSVLRSGHLCNAPSYVTLD